jgi:hypothetical protein
MNSGKKSPNFLHHQIRLLERGEMATPRHFRSLHDVEVLIDSTFGRSDRFLWEYGSC